MKRFAVIIGLVFSYGLNAQVVTQPSNNVRRDTNFVIVKKDPRIELIIKKQIEINDEILSRTKKTMPGYRIQVVNTKDRNLAIEAKTNMLQLYPEMKVYLYFQSPYFKVKLGNFKDRIHAEEIRDALQNLYPNGIYIIPETIELSLKELMELQRKEEDEAKATNLINF